MLSERFIYCIVSGLMLAVQSVYGAADGVPRKALKVAEAEVILPRTALRPVKSLIDSDAVPLDTDRKSVV